ncbi:MAG: hypothetical protein AAF449_07785, partial [Myxococcota bacterium]
FEIFEDFIIYCLDEGYSKVRALIVRPQGRGLSLATDSGLTAQQVFHVHELVKRYAKVLSISMLDLAQYPRSMVVIEPNGDVFSQSHASTQRAGNVLNTQDFREIWKDSGQFDHSAHLARLIGR